MALPGNGRWTGDPSLTQLGLQRYLLQEGYVDPPGPGCCSTDCIEPGSMTTAWS